MIDFTNLAYYISKVDPRDLIECVPFLKKGGVIKCYKATFHFLEITVYDSGRVEVLGSLHKFYNSIVDIRPPKNSIGKGFNGNDFNYSNLCFAIDYLVDFLQVDVKDVRVHSIEIGVNVEHQYNAKQILQNLMRFRGKQIRQNEENHFMAEITQQVFKCYNKNWHYNLLESVIRVEVRYKKIEAQGSKKLFLSDLKRKDVLSRFKSLLLKAWRDVLMYDYTIRRNELLAIDKEKILLFMNTNYWNDLSFNRMDRPKKRLKQITELHSEQIQDKIYAQIEAKWLELQEDCVTNDPCTKDLKNILCVTSDHLDKGSSITQPEIKKLETSRAHTRGSFF